jgi:bifunctional DNase/RNase
MAMILMRIRDMTFCPQHKRGVVVLEDAQRRLTLAFHVHPEEAPRLARLMQRRPEAFHPLHDFIRFLLEAFQATATHVVLDDMPDKGLIAFVYVQRAGSELSIPCYAPDALALAAQVKTPIFATPRALVHAEPQPPSSNGPDRGEDVREWLARVRPTDFHLLQQGGD